MADVRAEMTKLDIIEGLRQLTQKADVRELFEQQKLPCPGEPEDMRQYLATLAAYTKQVK